MTLNEYQHLAARTINAKLTDYAKEMHAVLGIGAENGEIQSIYQHSYQGKEVDPDKVIDELGDIMWFVCELAGALDTTLEAVCARNIRKLKKRYPEGFDDVRSEHRHEYGED